LLMDIYDCVHNGMYLDREWTVFVHCYINC
jgi:hypothetical protein